MANADVAEAIEHPLIGANLVRRDQVLDHGRLDWCSGTGLGLSHPRHEPSRVRRGKLQRSKPSRTCGPCRKRSQGAGSGHPTRRFRNGALRGIVAGQGERCRKHDKGACRACIGQAPAEASGASRVEHARQFF